MFVKRKKLRNTSLVTLIEFFIVSQEDSFSVDWNQKQRTHKHCKPINTLTHQDPLKAESDQNWSQEGPHFSWEHTFLVMDPEKSTPRRGTPPETTFITVGTFTCTAKSKADTRINVKDIPAKHILWTGIIFFQCKFALLHMFLQF